jgi:hypothetical protein
MPSQTSNTRRFFRFSAFIVIALWIVFLGWAVLNHQKVYDWWHLRGYTPPTAIKNLAAQDTMNDYAKRIFYVNEPIIEAKSAFSEKCPADGGEKTIVLGCYHSDQAGIFILNVDDPRLDGVEEVTAAHEMLHAAYDRLSKSERGHVDAMLQDFYDNGLTDERIKSTINSYKTTEPDDLVNEMHSIFGTEVANLPAPLEAYYKKYFTDRQQIAAFAAKYQSEFTSRKAQVAQYDAQLAGMKTQINNLEADLNAKQAQIDAEQSRLNSLRSSGDIDGYNAGVPGYNYLIDQYNAEVAQVKDLINQYNSLVETRNAVALEEGQLVKELSGSDINTINN